MSNVNFTVNDELVSVNVDGSDTLLSVLRNELMLTGTKCGCNQGVCGACTVLMDGLPVRACLSLAAACNGRQVTTVEGICGETQKEPSPVQTALINAGGLQCGFCTPGMVIALTAFLRDNPKPTREEVRHALSGNLCRCTGYTKIVDAAMNAAKQIAS